MLLQSNRRVVAEKDKVNYPLYREALEQYSKALELEPTCAVYHSNRAACHLVLGDPWQARQDARQATVLQVHSTLWRTLK